MEGDGTPGEQQLPVASVLSEQMLGKKIATTFLDKKEGDLSNNLVGALARAMRTGEEGPNEKMHKAKLWILTGIAGQTCPWAVFEALHSTSSIGKASINSMFAELQKLLEDNEDLFQKCKNELTKVDKNGSDLQVLNRLQDAVRGLAEVFKAPENPVKEPEQQEPPANQRVEFGDIERVEPVLMTQEMVAVIALCKLEDKGYLADKIDKLRSEGNQFVGDKAFQTNLGVEQDEEVGSRLIGSTSEWLTTMMFVILSVSLSTHRGVQEETKDLCKPESSPRQMMRAFVSMVEQVPLPWAFLQDKDLGSQTTLDLYASHVTEAFKASWRSGNDSSDSEDEAPSPPKKQRMGTEASNLEAVLSTFVENSSGSDKTLASANPNAIAKKHRVALTEFVQDYQDDDKNLPKELYKQILDGHESLSSEETNAAMMLIMGKVDDKEWLSLEVRQLQALAHKVLEEIFKDPGEVETEFSCYRTDRGCKEVMKRPQGDPVLRFDQLTHYLLQGNWKDLSFVRLFTGAISSSKNTEELFDEEQRPVIDKLYQLGKQKDSLASIFGARDGTSGGQTNTVNFAQEGFTKIFVPAMKALFAEEPAQMLEKTIRRFFNIVRRKPEFGSALKDCWGDFTRVLEEQHKRKFKDNSMRTDDGRLDFAGVKAAVAEVSAELKTAEDIMEQDRLRSRWEQESIYKGSTPDRTKSKARPAYAADGGGGSAAGAAGGYSSPPSKKKAKVASSNDRRTGPSKQGGGTDKGTGSSVKLNLRKWIEDFGNELCGHNFCKRGGCGRQHSFESTGRGQPCNLSHDTGSFKTKRLAREKETGKPFNQGDYLIPYDS